MTRQDLDDCLHLIHFRLMPDGMADGTMVRDRLPVGVYTWLMPVQQAIWKVQSEQQRAASPKVG